MDLLTTARSPWGESIFTHISWSLFWASLVGGLLFLLAHGGYMLFSQHRRRPSEEVDRLERERGGLPAQITRHGFVARAFHWVMAVSMLTLLVTAFLPDRGRTLRVGAVALDGRPAADRVDPVPHRPCDVLPGLLVDLGRAEGHPRVQGRNAARDGQGRRARTAARQVPARQSSLSPGGRGGRPGRRGHRDHDDVARAHRPRRAQPLRLRGCDVGLDLRAVTA